MTPLPIDSVLPEIVATVREHRSLVLVAPPGAGKTTRVPPALLSAKLLDAAHPNLVMLQPRRVAARAAAQRIADERGWEVGREVGYQVRFDRRIGPVTRLRVLTEGILTRQLLDDPFIEGVGAVILDEFHERSLHTDLAAALLREVRQSVRPDLILVVMSATLEAGPVSRFLGDCPIIHAEGRAYPVEIENVPAHVAARRDALPEAILPALRAELSRAPDPGDVLVFLPGVEEIRRTMRHLAQLAEDHDLLLLPLHGSLPAEEQTVALRPASRRKVILATNIAETSLTIDGVRTVIDGGLARVAGYDPQRGLDRLEVKRISHASATQRAGRAGRTAPGRCVRLWSLSEERAMSDFELPEILRVDLCATVLMLHAWGKTDPRAFGWYEPPPEQTLAAAERLLAMLGALDTENNGRITPLGRRLVGLPLHPRLGRLMIAAAEANLRREGATLAALMEEKDILRRESQAAPGQAPVPASAGPSDLLIRLALMNDAEGPGSGSRFAHDRVDPIALRQVARSRDELLRIAERLPKVPLRAGAQTGPLRPANASAEDALLKLILLAYPDRVARRRAADPGAAVMVGGGGVRLSPESVVCRSEFFVALDARQDERGSVREAFVRIASAVQVEWLEELFPYAIRRERSIVYDVDRERVVGRGAVYYRDLLLREDADAAVDPEQAGSVLAEALRPRAAEIFEADEAARNWLARLRMLCAAMPEHSWPPVDGAHLGELLASACRGKRSLDEVRRAGLAPMLESALQYPQDGLFEQHAPDALAVPSGSRIRLDYTSGPRPVLAVRLQELFGLIDTPRVAGGRVPVVLHLLGPNYRPVQITDDLRSFWSTTYFRVRKDLRTRYPKHAWPDDPLSAKPQAKGRSTRTKS